MLVHISTLRHTHKQACSQDFAKGGAWKLKVFFCLKNASIGWRAEQNAAAQSSRINGDLGAKLEMATAQRKRPRAAVGTLRRAAWQLKSA